jgi:cysteinyl-tRNA synthetase
MIKLYNTLTKTIDDFTPQTDNEISIYTCGPTLYNRVHIGNLSSFIYADTLKRALRAAFLNHQIKHVMNFTDVDDKTIKASREKYPDLEPMAALNKLTREYEDIFKNDLEEVGIDINDITFTRATDNIESMQKLIKKLLDSGFAYIADNGIYFSIEKYKEAGKKYGHLVEITAESTGQARVNNDEYEKDNIHDFALWKAQKENEPAWDFEVNGQNIKGRPGWHIECSAMSVNELGQPFDIHTGGVDLMFPHHENEIAQSTANNGDLLARFFFHSNHLLIDGKRMAKSSNNFYAVEDIKNKDFDPLAFRLLALQSHYQNQAHFSWDNLEAAQNRLQDLRAWADLRHQPKIEEMPEELDNNWRDMFIELESALSNNLNTPGALFALSKLVNYIQNVLIPRQNGKNTGSALHRLDEILGLRLDNNPDITDEQKDLISRREEARKNQDWQKSDEIRNKLKEQGIEIKDTDHGTVWSRV